MAVKRKNKKIDFKYNLKVYFSFLSKYKLVFIILAVLAFLNEALNLVSNYLFKGLVDNGTAFVNNGITRESFVYILLIIAGVYIGTNLIKLVVKFFSLHFINVMEGNLIFDLKRHFFNHILFLSHSFHITHRTGSLISRLSRGAGSVERMTDFIMFNVFPILFQLIIVSASLVYFDWISAVVVLLTAVAFIFYSLFMQNIQKVANVKMNETDDIEKAYVGDVFTNIDSIKYFGKEYSIRDRFYKISNNTKTSLIKFWHYFRWLDSGQSLILATGTFFLMYFPIKALLAREITLGTVVFIYSVYGSIFGNLFSFVSGIRNYYRAMTDFESLFQYGKIKQEVKDIKNAEKHSIETGEIEFKNVSFNFKKRKIFERFSLKIKPGEKIAVVGHSGSGKTTLVKLLFRFFDVDKGEILIDGKNIKEFNQEFLRSELSIVPQECILFDDTVYNNILFSNPAASKEEVLRAIKFAQLDKIIKKFPKRENTIVGERGVKLSGGEKQRVSIARAILANKRVIVLDEATSSLDSQTEHEIQKDLQKLLSGRTSIIIAHRLSTIMGADRIVVLQDGKIVQIGNHNELIKKQGTYKKLWDLQKGGYIGD